MEREKELQESVSQSARDRLEHMQDAIEGLKSDNRKLKEKCDGQEDELRETKAEVKELAKKAEQTKSEARANLDRLAQEKLELSEANTREKVQFQAELLKRVDEIQSLSNDKRELSGKIDLLHKELGHLKEALKRNEQHFELEKRAASDRFAQDRDELRAEHEHHAKVSNGKLAKVNEENERLNEEIARLKSNAMNDKLRFEEESLAQRAKWKQEEISKSKSYEERVELLIRGKDDLQERLSKLSVEHAESNTQLTASRKDHEACKRQCEQTQQLMVQRDLEFRNENNRTKLEVDSERRVNAELKDKVASQEIKIQELRSQMKDMQAEKESEKSRLQDQLRAKEDELKRSREEELRRAGMLETALQSYISSTRSAYK